jgi:hypothetical protein
MRMKPSLRALAVGVAVAGMMCVGGGAYAVTSITNSPAVNVTGPDHERLTITLAPGASRAFVLPAANDPLRIDLDAVSVNGGIQTPSEVFSALVNVDANGAGMTWIGTRSDGSHRSGYTFAGGPAITELRAALTALSPGSIRVTRLAGRLRSSRMRAQRLSAGHMS